MKYGFGKTKGSWLLFVAVLGVAPYHAFAEDDPYTPKEKAQDSRGLAHQFDMFEEYDPNNKEHVERVDQHFDKVDANDDGQWTQDEVGDAWFTPKRFANADKNSDGILTSEEVKGEIEWEGDHAGRLTHDLRKHTRQEVHAEMQQRWNNATPEQRAAFASEHPRAAQHLGGGPVQAQSRQRTYTDKDGNTVTMDEQRRRNEEGDVEKRRRAQVTNEEGEIVGEGRQKVRTTDEGTIKKGDKSYTTDEGTTVDVQKRTKIGEDGRVIEQTRKRETDAEGNVIQKGAQERGKNAEGDKYRKQKQADDEGNMRRRREGEKADGTHVQQRQRKNAEGKTQTQQRGRR